MLARAHKTHPFLCFFIILYDQYSESKLAHVNIAQFHYYGVKSDCQGQGYTWVEAHWIEGSWL